MDEISLVQLDRTKRRFLVKPCEHNEVDLACQAEDESQDPRWVWSTEALWRHSRVIHLRAVPSSIVWLDLRPPQEVFFPDMGATGRLWADHSLHVSSFSVLTPTLGLRLSDFRTARSNLLTQAPPPLLHLENDRPGMPDDFACHLIQAPAYRAHWASTPGLG
jgi:hypothetical protein